MVLQFCDLSVLLGMKVATKGILDVSLCPEAHQLSRQP